MFYYKGETDGQALTTNAGREFTGREVQEESQEVPVHPHGGVMVHYRAIIYNERS